MLYEEAIDSLSGAQLILMSQLQLLLSNHDIQNISELSCEYAAALIAVASCLVPLKANISDLLFKWSIQLLSLDNITVRLLLKYDIKCEYICIIKYYYIILLYYIIVG